MGGPEGAPRRDPAGGTGRGSPGAFPRWPVWCIIPIEKTCSAHGSEVVLTERGTGMPRRGGNAFRPSQAAPDLAVINNLPGLYPVEDWRAYYWAVADDGSLSERYVTVQLPLGYANAGPPVARGELGCIYHVRRWGLACRPSLLEAIGFDLLPLLGPDALPSEVIRVYLEATHFDLPGGFIIADPDYPLLLFDPGGDLKGSCISGISYLGALAWMVTGGQVAADFQRMRRETPEFYRRAVEGFGRLLHAGKIGGL